MKKSIYIITTLAALASIASCDSYLDRQPDDQLTAKNVFEKEASTRKYLVNVYSFIPDMADQSGQNTLYGSCSDEISTPYSGRFCFYVSHNNYSPLSTAGVYRNTCYKNLWYGIREATFFLQHVDECPELSVVEVSQMAAEARFLRAFYYTELLRLNGPVVFLGDNLADFTDPSISKMDRAPWQTIVDWVCNEYDLAAADLPDSWGSSDLGHATKGAALAMKAKLLLYNARPLFNGQNGTGMYDDVVNNNGEKLFNTDYDENRWKLASDACKEVIDLGLYRLVEDDTKTPVENYHEAFIGLNTTENIFTRQQSAYSARVVSTPAGIGGTCYGGASATQKIVDAFAMKNGYYPVKNLDQDNYGNGLNPEFDAMSGYSETGSTSFVNPYFATIPQSKQTAAINTPNMYVDREPRFYANIFWSGQTWVSKTVVKTNIQFYQKGVNGPQTSNNYSTTGYLAIKFVDPNVNTTTGEWGYISFPIVRYADILLMYIEALNEVDPTNPDILTYWNMIRHRAGVPAIGTEDDQIYPEIVGDKELQRKYIRQERFVEMCFEGSRYFDTRTWMTAEREDNGDVVGMNIKCTNHTIGGDFWKRVSIFDGYGEGGFTTRRSFLPKNYLLPVNQEEIDRTPDITQNYGW